MTADRSMISIKSLSAFLLLAALMLFADLGPVRADDTHTPLEPIPCPGERAKGEAAACFILHVPADWTDLSNRSMELPVMRYAPLGDKATKPPLLVLAGGPGQSVIRLERTLANNLKTFRQDRELILMDQRGTGPLADHLLCADALRNDQQVLIPALADCIGKAEADGFPQSDYSTAFAVQDYRALRYALKIDQWAILASSYGARVAQGLIAVDEKGIDRIVFNGPLFKGTAFFDWQPKSKVESALDLCNEQDACRAAFPNLYWDFERIPFEIRKVKQTKEESLPAGLLVNLYRKRLQALLARHRLDEVPADITATLDSLLTAQAEDTIWVPPSPLPQKMRGIGLMMHFAILCAEEIDRLSDQEPRDLAQPYRVMFYRAACKAIRDQSQNGVALDDTWSKARKSAKPILIFHGVLDTIVNPDATKKALALYQNASLIFVANAGHDIVSNIACAREVMAHFLDGAAPHALDNLCADQEAVRFKRELSSDMTTRRD